MGELDAVTKEYLKDARVVADIGNFKLYGGEFRIWPEMLREMDTTVLTVPYGTDHAALPVQKFRDRLVAVVDGKTPRIVCLILGNEAEGKIHYAEPVKTMYYDVGQYADQVNRAAASRRQERRENKKEQEAKRLKEKIVQQLKEEGWIPRAYGGHSDGRINMEEILQMASETLAMEEAAAASEDVAAAPSEKTSGQKEHPTSGEFLGNFYRTDRLVPVITIVLHLSPEHWDAPRTLHEMFGDIDEVLLRHIPDYHINLISPEELTEKDLDMFRTDLREVLLYIKYSKDKDKLRQLKDTRRFRSISQAALDVINKATNSNIPPVMDEKGDCDMCEGLAGMLEDARAEGRQEMCEGLAGMLEDARAEGRQEMCEGLAGMLEDARAEGRQEMCEGFAGMLEDARAEVREEMTAKYEGKLEDTKVEYEGKLEDTKVEYEGKLEKAKADYEGELERTILESIRNVMKALRYSCDQAMQVLNVPEADYTKYRAML